MCTYMGNNVNVEEIFGQNVFTLAKMRERLPKNVSRLKAPLAAQAAVFANKLQSSVTVTVTKRIHYLAAPFHILHVFRKLASAIIFPARPGNKQNYFPTKRWIFHAADRRA